MIIIRRAGASAGCGASGHKKDEVTSLISHGASALIARCGSLASGGNSLLGQFIFRGLRFNLLRYQMSSMIVTKNSPSPLLTIGDCGIRKSSREILCSRFQRTRILWVLLVAVLCPSSPSKAYKFKTHELRALRSCIAWKQKVVSRGILDPAVMKTADVVKPASGLMTAEHYSPGTRMLHRDGKHVVAACADEELLKGKR